MVGRAFKVTGCQGATAPDLLELLGKDGSADLGLPFLQYSSEFWTAVRAQQACVVLHFQNIVVFKEGGEPFVCLVVVHPVICFPTTMALEPNLNS